MIAGILDVILIMIVEPNSSLFLLAQAGIAWTLFGWIVLSTKSGLKPMLHSILITILINIPRYINIAIFPGQWSYLPPLVIQSIVFGAMFGLFKVRLEKINETSILN